MHNIRVTGTGMQIPGNLACSVGGRKAGTVSLACSMQYSRVGGLGVTEGHVGGIGGLMDFNRAEKLKSMVPFCSRLVLWFSPLSLVHGSSESRLCTFKDCARGHGTVLMSKNKRSS